MRWIALICAGAMPGWSAAALADERPGRDEVVRALLERSRLLQDVRFNIPGSLYREYLRITSGGEAMFPPPVASIAESGRYHLTLDEAGRPTLSATVALGVFKPRRCRNLPVLMAEWAWEKVAVNGAPATLVARKGWLRFTPKKAGRHVISGQIGLKDSRTNDGKVSFDIPATVMTSLRFDSPGLWQVAVSGSPHKLLGQAAGGTHGELAVAPRERMEVTYTRPVELPPRPPRYELRGVTAWNIDAGRQQIAARLNLRILGGQTDRLVLHLPASARRVSISGPDVREARVSAGRATVFLRGAIAGQSRLDVNCELPIGPGSIKRLERIELQDGHWSEGTLVITNTAGGSEILPHAVSGLREVHPEDLPSEVRGILAGKPVLAYEIASRGFSAAVDVVNLGEFALRESIADLAHYQLLLRPDGCILCKVDYEVRNRNRQFLRVHLPREAQVLVARVNDKPRALTPLAAEPGAYLLPLVRSQASVKGLVSFPVQIVVLMRGKALQREGLAAVPLPRIDLPIAYGWCEMHVPRDMAVGQWAGPMQHVERYSSETAVASLTYGRAELAEGYRPEDRPTVTTAPEGEREPGRKQEPRPAPVAATKPPEPKPQRPTAGPDRLPGPATMPAAPEVPATKVTVPEGGTLVVGGQVMLSRNYYRAGRDYYERGDYDKAAVSLENTLRMAPNTAEAANAARLLANIKAVRGKLAAKSREEKALTRQVKSEISGLNVKLEQQQRELIEQAGEAVRRGQRGQAAAGYQAAVSLGEQLIARGADEKEQAVRLRGAKEELDRLQEHEQTRATQLRERYKTLKTSGRYEEALEIGKALQKVDGSEGGQERLRDELEELAVTTVRRRKLPDDAEPRDLASRIATPRGEARTRGRTEDLFGRMPVREEGPVLAPGRGTSSWFGSAFRPAHEAAAAREVTVTGGGKIATEVLAVKNAEAREVARALEEVLSAPAPARGRRLGPDKKVTITADETTNALVLTAPPGERDKIVEMIRHLDAASPAGKAEVMTPEG
ncbi:MAG: secretin N-terminal domain-containing protein, partial [Phycisphaerae bacterium]